MQYHYTKSVSYAQLQLYIFSLSYFALEMQGQKKRLPWAQLYDVH